MVSLIFKRDCTQGLFAVIRARKAFKGMSVLRKEATGIMLPRWPDPLKMRTLDVVSWGWPGQILHLLLL